MLFLVQTDSLYPVVSCTVSQMYRYFVHIRLSLGLGVRQLQCGSAPATLLWGKGSFSFVCSPVCKQWLRLVPRSSSNSQVDVSHGPREQIKVGWSWLVQQRGLISVGLTVHGSIKAGWVDVLPGVCGIAETILMLTVTSSSFQSQTGPWTAFWGVFKASFCRWGTTARSEGESWIRHPHDVCVSWGIVYGGWRENPFWRHVLGLVPGPCHLKESMAKSRVPHARTHAWQIMTTFLFYLVICRVCRMALLHACLSPSLERGTQNFPLTDSRTPRSSFCISSIWWR